MTTKERVEAQLSSLDENEMSQLLIIIEQMAQKGSQPATPREPGLLSKLKQVKIEAPEDFAANLDAYMIGEKQSGDSSDVH